MSVAGARGRKRALIASGILVALTGCGTTESGSPGAESSNADERMSAYQDPCTIPVSALTAAGLNVEDERPGTIGVEFNGWKGCSWTSTADEYAFSVNTGPRKLADFQQDSTFARSYTAAEEVTLGGRAARVFVTGPDPDRRAMCAVGVETSTGMTLFQTIGATAGDKGQPGDRCDETVRVATALIGRLPEADAGPPPSTPASAVQSESDVLAIFGNLDPCTVVTQAEVDQMTGTSGLAPNRTVDVPGRSATCAWGGERPALQIGFHGLVKDDYTITPPNDRSKQLSAEIGRAVDLSGYDATDCSAMTMYENPRRMVFLLVDPPGDDRIEGGVCGRALPTIEAVLSERISWP